MTITPRLLWPLTLSLSLACQKPMTETTEVNPSQGAEIDERRATAEALVERFWSVTWNPPHDVDVVDELMTEDFVITSAGSDVVGREAFKAWIRGFQEKAGNLRLDSHETFANADGTRVVSRWTAHAVNHGVFGLPDDGREFTFTGIAIWEIRWSAEGPRLAHNWVERSAYEAYRTLADDSE